MKPITTTQSTSLTVLHDGLKGTVRDLLNFIDGIQGDTGYCIYSTIIPGGTELYFTNMEVSESGETDDSFQEVIQQFQESLEDLGFTVQ